MSFVPGPRLGPGADAAQARHCGFAFCFPYILLIFVLFPPFARLRSLSPALFGFTLQL